MDGFAGSADFLFDYLCDFALFGKPLSFDVMLGVDQLPVAFDVEDSTFAFDQLNLSLRHLRLQFRFHPGSMRKIVSSPAVLDDDFHNSSFTSLNCYAC